ncbi:hypothetical protein [Bacillus atrophaeus]|nr:hypothetical protein [Bacillus atrophaeus]MEC0841995.1 hypothetical protein [Bacillus spizizenii]MED1125385.1 hypothetical protein [Bacillus atrophaeus]
MSMQIKEYVGYFGSDNKDKEVVTKRKDAFAKKSQKTNKAKAKKK